MRQAVIGFFVLFLPQAVMGASIGHEGATPGIAIHDQKSPNSTMHLDSINILDKSLQHIGSRRDQYIGKISVERSGLRRSETGNIEVVAVIRNRTDYPLQIEGRVQFLDQNGLPIEKPSAWQRVYLSPQGVSAYREFSTTPDAKHYYVEIREGR